MKEPQVYLRCDRRMQNKLHKGCILASPFPGTFAGLMEMYEMNYIRIRKLCGAKDDMPAVAVSRIKKGSDLYLQVLEQTRYTATIVLTYYFSDSQSGFLAYPDLKIRVYYDALQAEVMSQAYQCNKPNFKAFNYAVAPSIVKRWRMNRFLYKWLSYCGHQGHSFLVADKSRQNHLRTENVEIPLQGSDTLSIMA